MSHDKKRRSQVEVRRETWGYDPRFDRCQPYDNAGQHLGTVWFEEKGDGQRPQKSPKRDADLPNVPQSTRRSLLAGLFAMPGAIIAALLALFGGSE